MNLLFIRKITVYIFTDLMKNRMAIGYALFLAAVSFGLFMMESHTEKAFLAILNVVLLAVPLFSIVFSTIYYYNSYEFISLLLAQPIKRTSILISIFAGLSGAFLLFLILGIGIPLLVYLPEAKSLVLFGVAALLSFVFVALALLGGIAARDKSRGIGISLLVWMYFVLLFDGIILILMYNFSDYPIEKFVILISFLNPVDLSRILVLMQTEASSLMGYSGALFKKFFDNAIGPFLSFTGIFAWAMLPLLLSIWFFKKRNL